VPRALRQALGASPREIWAVQGAQQMLLPHALQLARISRRADLVEVVCRPVIGVEKCRDVP